MLAKRKEEFDLYEEEIALDPAKAKKPIVNKKLRAESVILILLVSALAMFTTIRSEVIVSDGYALVKMKSDALKLEKENERLKLDIAQMKAPQRIKQIAITELDMVVPEDVYFASKNGE